MTSLPADAEGYCSLIVQQFYGPQAQEHRSVLSVEKRSRISSWRSMAWMTAGFCLLEQDHILDGSGGFGAFASTFNSNSLSVPSE